MTQAAKDLLKFSFDYKDFVARSDQVFTYSEKKLLKHSTKFLDHIAETFSTNDLEPPKHINLESLLQKVEKLFKQYVISPDISSLKDKISLSDLRKLTYSLDKFNAKPPLLVFVLQLLNLKWRNSYINGLLYSLLNYWEFLELHNRHEIHQLLTQKITSYTGRSNKYIDLQNHLHFLDTTKGPLLLGSYAYKHLSSPLDLPTVFSLRQTAITYSYFHRAIFTYYKKKIDDLPAEAWIEQDQVQNLVDNIQSTFNSFNSSFITKTVIASLIIRANEFIGSYINIQALIKRLAFRYIGDTSVESKWNNIAKGNKEDINNLTLARAIIRKWEIQQCISLFFEKCVSDLDRKRYWLQYVDYIKSLRIIGARSVKNELKTDSRLVDIIDSIFIVTDSTQSQTAALAMHIDDYIMVEFSDTGAFYVYNETSSYAKFFNRKRVYTINDLKQPYLKSIVRPNSYGAYDLYKEGRLVHNGNWQYRLDIWLENMTQIPFN